MYLKAYEDSWVADQSFGWHFAFYNTRPPHPALEYQTPAEVYRAEAA